MPDLNHHVLDRRLFLGATGAVLALSGTSAVSASAVERPPVKEPRATSGDTAVEPKWDERLTLTVGATKGNLIGGDEKVIQAAVDYLARLGGGTVKLLPGTFKLRNAVYLSSNIRISGSGRDTLLIKEPSFKSKLLLDSDWFDQEITLADPKGFQVGDGICLRAKSPQNTATVIKRTIIARSGNRFKLDKGLRENLWLMGEATAATLFPLLTGEFISNIAVEDLVLDGNRANNENLDGNYAGCIFLQDCKDVSIKSVEARNNNGDGISWQICHDVTVENCHSHGHAGLGLHPGSGSQRPIMRGNTLQHNDIGLFFCWGVKYGLAENNIIEDNGSSGISVGHRDTDNLIISNDIKRSGKVGILFRPERGKAFTGNRNRVEGNKVLDCGADDGIAIDVQGETADLVFAGNDLRESRGPGKRVGIRLGANSGDITMTGNRLEGFATNFLDQRKR